MKKLISGLIILAMALSLTTAVSATTANVGNGNLVVGRIQSLAKEKISATGSDIKISTSKTLHDFSGNTYELIECNPTGYFIIHPKSGVTVEYSTSDQSPYKGYNSDLYYGGPTYYYIKSGNSYVHTVLGTTVTDVKEAAVTCDTTEKNLESHANVAVQNYLNGKTSGLSGSSVSALANTNYMVKHPDFFQNLNSGFGYEEGGYCGYIAANLILKYWWAHSSINFAYPYYVTDNTSLTNKLISIGGSGGTWAQPIASTINTFASQQGFPQSASWHIGVEGMLNEIQNYRRPVILFGNLKSAGLHAVVCYGFNTYENPDFYTFICHYGYDKGWTNVHICGLNSLFGSNTQYNLPDSYQY